MQVVEDEAFEREIRERLAKKDTSDFTYYVRQLGYRLILLAVGGGFGFGAFLSGRGAIALLSQPFAATSPLQLLGGLALGVFALVLGMIGFAIAFIELDTKEEWKANIEGTTRNELRDELEKLGRDRL